MSGHLIHKASHVKYTGVDFLLLAHRAVDTYILKLEWFTWGIAFSTAVRNLTNDGKHLVRGGYIVRYGVSSLRMQWWKGHGELCA